MRQTTKAAQEQARAARPERPGASRRRRFRLLGAGAGAVLVLSSLGGVVGAASAAGAATPKAPNGAEHTDHHAAKPAAGPASAARLPHISTSAKAAKAKAALKQFTATHKANSTANASSPKLNGPAPAAVTPSATFTVDTTADTNPPSATAAETDCAAGNTTTCSLRAAVEAASAANGPAAVVVPNGLYVLSYGQLDLANATGMVLESKTGNASTAVIDAANSTSVGPAGPAGAVSTPLVTLSTQLGTHTATYTIHFTSSVSGALAKGGTITITAPTGTVLPATPGTYEVTGNHPTHVTSTPGTTATLTIGETYPEGHAFTVMIDTVANPAAAVSDTLTVATSADTTAVTSAPYSILADTPPATNAVQHVSVSLSTSRATQTGVHYTVHFDATTPVAATGTVTLVAPAGTKFSPTATNYELNGTATKFSTATPATTTSTVTLKLKTGMTDGTNHITALTVTNPMAPSAAEVLSVETSTDTTPTWSAPYGIEGATAPFRVALVDLPATSNVTTVDNLTLEGGIACTGAGLLDGYIVGWTGPSTTFPIYTGAPLEVNGSIFLNDHSSARGGGLLAGGTTYLTDDTFVSDSACTTGGGLASYGPLFVSGVTLAYDWAGHDGGGAALYATVDGTGVTAVHDQAGAGGGLYTTVLTATLTNVTVTDDTACFGGGMFSWNLSTHVTDLTATTDTSAFGGGLFDLSASSTISGANISTDQALFGGGFIGAESALTMTNGTVDHNEAPFGGGTFLSSGEFFIGCLPDTTCGTTGGSAVFNNVSFNHDIAVIGGGVNDFPFYYYSFTCIFSTHGTDFDCSPIYTVGASLTINGGSMSTDTAELGGGGLYNSEPATLNGVAVNSDRAESGGGIFDAYSGAHTILTAKASLAMTGGSLSTDGATGGTGTRTGGGLFAGFYASAMLTGVTMSDDFAAMTGGAIAVRWQDSVSVTGGSITGSSAVNGGGIAELVGGNLTLSGVAIDGNTATTTGGGIVNRGSALTMTGGSLSGNTAHLTSGGALDNDAGATLSGVVVTGNTDAAPWGGGLANYGGMSVRNSTISGNTSTAGGTPAQGAGIYNDGSLHLSGSTVSGNKAAAGSTGYGVGLFNSDTAILVNDTVEGNTVGTGSGAGIYNDTDGRLSLTEVTVAGNTVTAAPTGTDAAGGLDNAGLVQVGYSIFAGDTVGGTNAECLVATGDTISSLGYNVASDSSCGLEAVGDQQTATPMLGPLATNGGTTQTMALPASSPAVNVKAAGTCSTSTDQRGDARPSTITGVTGCDAGAYQLQAGAVPPTVGYWLDASDGGVFTFGSAGFFGSKGATHLNSPVVGMAATPTGGGYWLVGADGGIFTFGNATYHGSVPGLNVSVSDVVGMAATPTGGGYWVVGADGAVYPFGSAGNYGSVPGLGIHVSDVVGMAAMSTGGGYWLVGSDGAIFAFGSASYLGSMGGAHLNAPVVGMAATPTGGGYWEVASDGGIFTFGNATYHGSMGGSHLNQPVVGMAATSTGGGYWEVASDGGIFTFGNAAFLGSMGGTPLNEPVVGMAAMS